MSDADFLWKLITISMMLATLAGTIISVVVALRRKPPLVEELYRSYATKAELEESFKSFRASQSIVCDRHARELQEARRARDEELRELREHNDSVHKELFGVIRSTQEAIHKDVQVLERAIGRLEGIKPPKG